MMLNSTSELLLRSWYIYIIYEKQKSLYLKKLWWFAEDSYTRWRASQDDVTWLQRHEPDQEQTQMN